MRRKPYDVRSSHCGMCSSCSATRSRSRGPVGRSGRGCACLSCRASLAPGRTALVGDLAGAADHVVDEAVLLGLPCGEPAVPVGIGLDLLERLAGVLADQLEQHLLDVKGLLSLDLDVGGR